MLTEIRTYEMNRYERIESAILKVLHGYGCRVPTACIFEELRHKDEFRYGLTQDDVYNRLYRLKKKGIISGGMRYKGCRGWQIKTNND